MVSTLILEDKPPFLIGLKELTEPHQISRQRHTQILIAPQQEENYASLNSYDVSVFLETVVHVRDPRVLRVVATRDCAS